MSVSTKASRLKMLACVLAVGGVVPVAGVSAETVVAWGSNSTGQLGNGSTGGFSAVPAVITSLGDDVTQVAAGNRLGLAVKGGAAYAWGQNSNGQLGNGNNTPSATPGLVTGLGSGVTAVAAGSAHSMAIQNGAALAWGYFIGLGSNSFNDSRVPVQVTGLASGVTTISAGELHAGFAIQGGALSAWGLGTSGQLGNGSTGLNFTPGPVTGMGAGVTAVAGGFFHTLGVQNGAAFAWGENTTGQLGDGTTTRSLVPVAVVGLGTGVTAVSAGNAHSLAVKDGNVYAWGSNASGQIGNGSVGGNVTTAQLVLDLPVSIVDVAASNLASYALSSDGSIWVWGSNTEGQLGLGLGTDAQVLAPTQLLAPAGFKFTAIDASASDNFVMALMGPAVVAVAGDYNGDGFVDAADYTVWADHFGQSGAGVLGDGNGDGVVDAADYTIWADNFGQGTPPAGLGAVVPEPGVMGGVMVLAGLLGRRRR